MSLKNAGQAKKGGGRIAGLPTYVWLGVIAGGLLLGLYLRSRGGGSSSSAPVVDTSSTPASIDSGGSGGLFTGLSGQSAGGDTTATVDNGMSDLLNALAVQSQDTEALTQQIAGLSLVGPPVVNVGSSGGSGAGHGKPKQKPHHKPPTKHHAKQNKAHQKRNRKKVAA